MSPDTSVVMFRREYEVELESWLRRRFVYLCATYAALIAGWTALVLLSRGLDGGWLGPGALWTARGALSLSVVGFFYLCRGRHQHRDDVLRSASQMILILGAISIGSRLVGWAGDAAAPTAISVLWALLFWHVTACLFLPWTPRDSMRPILPLLAIWAAYTLMIGDGTFGSRALSVVFGPGILVPGLLICGFRLRQHHQRFRSIMLGRQYTSIRQEMTRARTIHDSMFPAEYDDGNVRVEYAYRPMRELGGDFLHVASGAGGLLHVTLLDVTGHGLAAALTVNRLYGELERIRAESPGARPGEVLALLNRYVALTMARHNIFATAIAITIDPAAGELRWSSAGHPPAFLRGANRVVRALDSTGLMLGAIADEGEGEPFEERRTELSPGDVIVCYTDGAYEARDRGGRALGLPRLRGLLDGAPPPEGWPCSICTAVDRHRIGRAEDDVLVAAITFSRPRRPAAAPQRTAVTVGA